MSRAPGSDIMVRAKIPYCPHCKKKIKEIKDIEYYSFISPTILNLSARFPCKGIGMRKVEMVIKWS
jgi:hypothetical protein